MIRSEELYVIAPTFGCYADPVALPAVAGLPGALAASAAEIARLAPRPAPPRGGRARRRRRAASIPVQGYAPAE
ncbi:MAG: hypothetical protein ACR2KV_00960 [Solirubrobacteraceae bacterium]